MSRTRVRILTAALVAVLLLPGLAAAQQQSISINIGQFAVSGESRRVAGDTLVENLGAQYPFALDYRIEDFNNVTIGGEWLIRMGKYLEAGVGVGFYSKTVGSRYLDLTDKNDRDIVQDLQLRIVPVTATFRYFPLSHRAVVQPYIGAGVGVLVWRYSETGDFVDGNQNIFRGNYVASGTRVGPVVLGGLRLPVNHNFSLGGELRYQQGDAALGEGFVGTKIDLGGMSYLLNFVIRF